MLLREPKGAVLPLGGDELGHKGFALALIVEMMTASLGGFGRADATDHWGASVFMQILDPAKFGGAAAFRRESSALAASCRAAKPRPGMRVRMPGERAQSERRRQLHESVNLHPDIAPMLAPWAKKFGIAKPAGVVTSARSN